VGAFFYFMGSQSTYPKHDGSYFSALIFKVVNYLQVSLFVYLINGGINDSFLQHREYFVLFRLNTNQFFEIIHLNTNPANILIVLQNLIKRKAMFTVQASPNKHIQLHIHRRSFYGFKNGSWKFKVNFCSISPPLPGYFNQ